MTLETAMATMVAMERMKSTNSEVAKKSALEMTTVFVRLAVVAASFHQIVWLQTLQKPLPIAK